MLEAFQCFSQQSSFHLQVECLEGEGVKAVGSKVHTIG
jgi:hypothetical protein